MRLLGAKLKKGVSKGESQKRRGPYKVELGKESYGDQNRIRGVENVGFSSGDGKIHCWNLEMKRVHNLGGKIDDIEWRTKRGTTIPCIQHQGIAKYKI